MTLTLPRGNKKGGLANIVEKAMGSIAKSGTSQIVEVLSPGGKADKTRPDLCGNSGQRHCMRSQPGSQRYWFTGIYDRAGTPYGLDICPVIKVCSRNEMKNHWFDLIDISAGEVATGEKNHCRCGAGDF